MKNKYKYILLTVGMIGILVSPYLSFHLYQTSMRSFNTKGLLLFTAIFTIYLPLYSLFIISLKNKMSLILGLLFTIISSLIITGHIRAQSAISLLILSQGIFLMGYYFLNKNKL